MSTAPPEQAPAWEDGGGPALWAYLGVRLDSLTAELKRANDKRERLFQSLHQVPVSGPALDTAGQVADYPEMLGPHLGWFWDIRRLTFAAAAGSTWTGTIYLYRSQPVPSALMDTWTPAGPVSRLYGKATFLLPPGERLVYVASADFSGTVVPGGDATQAAADVLAVYLS